MPSFSFPDAIAVLPLRAVIFQCLLLLVAVSLEAMVFRNQLRMGFQPSIRYAMILNLLSVVLGWFLFLGLEPLLPNRLRIQIISYILFGSFFGAVGTNQVSAIVVLLGLLMFFLTFWIKATGLEWLTWLVGNPIVKPTVDKDTNRFRYRRAATDPQASSPHILVVLQANALSFTAVLLLLLLRHRLG
jgi:hypothetical protein